MKCLASKTHYDERHPYDPRKPVSHLDSDGDESYVSGIPYKKPGAGLGDHGRGENDPKRKDGGYDEEE